MEQFGFVLPKWGRCCPSNPKNWKTTPCKVGRVRYPRHSSHSILGSRLSAQLRPCVGLFWLSRSLALAESQAWAASVFVNEFNARLFERLSQHEQRGPSRFGCTRFHLPHSHNADPGPSGELCWLQSRRPRAALHCSGVTIETIWRCVLIPSILSKND